jgi:flagellar biosynthesis protein FlhF
MNVRKFFAQSSRQALQLVRQGLGPDALILSNRPIDGGMEILAVARDEMQAMGSGAAAGAAAPAQPAATEAAPAAAAPSRPEPAAPAASGRSVEELIRRSLSREMKAIHQLFEQQQLAQSWELAQARDPGRAGVQRSMLHAGFSAALARQFVARMPEGLDATQKVAWVRAGLDRNLRTAAASEELVERGGVYALVGPTGVGKTTTVAKIAARCVVRHGAERLALLTTDGYRIGAHEQLRIYGKLLGVRVIGVKDGNDLQCVLEDLRGKHLVLIDTVGMSQRDQLVPEQLAMLSEAGVEVRRLLLLNATGNGETLDEVVRVYGGAGVTGCILTKTDEAAGLATALDVVIRHKLALHYVTDGQRVPEDLHLPDRERLLGGALRRVSAPTAHHLNADESHMMLASVPLARLTEGAALV